ncbi:hypothetical protein [uncultured Polaribacter sp.]|uniref:hypothetical protein n=1 Tax=uncultured Polaribacter sp. TaxID=174711 RepID=UPI002607B480|nr:hypothetical protein [uncultured Polaribacter sp.]
MKKQLIFFLLFTILSYSQEKRKIINGKVKSEIGFISDIHILNLNTKVGTITNDSGWFEIPVVKGDSLQFSHINYKENTIIITKKIISKNIIEVELEDKTYHLEEITYQKPKTIFETYNEVKRYEGPKVNAKKLSLPYANTKIKKDEAIFKFRSGGVVSLDNLLNSLNGNKKRNKHLVKLINEDALLSKIRKQFTDDFFITDLKIKKENINTFLNYCKCKNIIYLFKKEENIKLTKVLIAESKGFSQKPESYNLFITKKNDLTKF